MAVRRQIQVMLAENRVCQTSLTGRAILPQDARIVNLLLETLNVPQGCLEHRALCKLGTFPVKGNVQDTPEDTGQEQSNQRTWTKTSVVMRGNWQYNRSGLPTDWPGPTKGEILMAAGCPTTQAMYEKVGIESIATEVGE